MPFRNMPRIGALACLEVKMIGKPYAGELHVRFDEGEQVFVARRILNGHEAGNGGDKPRIDLTNTEPVLYSTSWSLDPHGPSLTQFDGPDGFEAPGEVLICVGTK
jgi:hypothetical protein